jgi:hypothetical protein
MGIENSSPKSGQMETVIGIYTEKGRWELKTPLSKEGSSNSQEKGFLIHIPLFTISDGLFESSESVQHSRKC